MAQLIKRQHEGHREQKVEGSSLRLRGSTTALTFTLSRKDHTEYKAALTGHDEQQACPISAASWFGFGLLRNYSLTVRSDCRN